MQERYLGDSHDFIKYALLRRIHQQCCLDIGLNWYLTCPEELGEAENGDGEKRHHLKGGAWHSWDAELLKSLNFFSDTNQREISKFESSGILPESCVFYGDHVPVEERLNWHKKALEDLNQSDFVFLDPDNGFIVKSATKSRKRKYAIYPEVADYFRSGQTVCSIQFARQCDPIKKANAVRNALSMEAGVPINFPVLRGRVAPNILFVFLPQPQHEATLLSALEDFCHDSGGKAELIF
ncbi:hypothetical protein [Shimia thalassica]|uniref:hypothetical protein n=1 Tax=Shimia thalassica TaxID=1715693 RepID=UPI0026E202C9|nr:hypothetical protein [Shimia thalassica]MDO6798202.1 hypothetical protein [Shimia thalassica]